MGVGYHGLPVDALPHSAVGKAQERDTIRVRRLILSSSSITRTISPGLNREKRGRTNDLRRRRANDLKRRGLYHVQRRRLYYLGGRRSDYLGGRRADYELRRRCRQNCKSADLWSLARRSPR